MGKSKSLAQQIADLDNSAPKDFDPEDSHVQRSDEDSVSDSVDGLAGTEHYTAVGKSKLRKPEEVALGSKYAGSRISRKDLMEVDEDEEGDSEPDREEGGVFADPEDINFDVDKDDGEIDSEAAFGDGDAEIFKKFTFRGSNEPKTVMKNGRKKRPIAADFMSSSEDEEEIDDGQSEEDETDEDILDVDAQHAKVSKDGSEEALEDEDDDEDMEGQSDKAGSGEDQEMADGSEDESEDADEDDEKARRAELRKIMNEEQKSVVATISNAAKADAVKGNAVFQQRKTFDSLLSVRIALQKGVAAANSLDTTEDKDGEETGDEPYQAAEDAAIKLWNTIDSLRQELVKASGAKTGQKRKRGIENSTKSTDIWEKMQDSELAFLDTRQTTLEKWSNKVKDGSALPLSRKLNTALPQSKLASLRDLIVKKASENGNTSFDDTKFYKTLLNNFVDQRRMDATPASGAQNGGPAQFTVVKEAKMRKKVDTKASKGRKMRFTVQEKLQNFMAPEDRSSWEPEAIERFFGTLLGQKMTLGEDAEVDEDGDEEIPLEEQGLMLFRS